MDGAHYPSYCVDANSLWIEEPCEQQQVHEIASILQKNDETEYSMTFYQHKVPYAVHGTCLSLQVEQSKKSAQYSFFFLFLTISKMRRIEEPMVKII